MFALLCGQKKYLFYRWEGVLIVPSWCRLLRSHVSGRTGSCSYCHQLLDCEILGGSTHRSQFYQGAQSRLVSVDDLFHLDIGLLQMSTQTKGCIPVSTPCPDPDVFESHPRCLYCSSVRVGEYCKVWMLSFWDWQSLCPPPRPSALGLGSPTSLVLPPLFCRWRHCTVCKLLSCRWSRFAEGPFSKRLPLLYKKKENKFDIRIFKSCFVFLFLFLRIFFNRGIYAKLDTKIFKQFWFYCQS